MKIKLELFGASRDLSNKEFLELNLEEKSSIKDLRKTIINYVDQKFKGNEKLVCPYHAWSYDDEGYPKNIPMEKECFNISRKDFKKLRLENWNVDYCGNFIFLSSRKNTKTLKSYLGAQYSYLKDISHKIPLYFHKY